MQITKHIYWDIGSEAKIKKVEARFRKQKVSQSQIIRTVIKMTTMDDMVKMLHEDMKHAEFIDIDKL